MAWTRPLVGPSQGEWVFMVEAYRSAAAVNEPPGGSRDHGHVVCVIDIPHDEVVIYLIRAPDGPTAERFIRDRGGRPIRVVNARWCPAPAVGPR